MKQLLLYICILGTSFQLSAQVGINNTDPKAALDISAGATLSETDGILIPRVDEYPTGVSGDQDGMLVFLTGAGAPSKGFYYWDQTSTTWIAIAGLKNTLDEAYDEGGAGSGRTITADSGALNIQGEDGFQVTGTFGSGDDVSLGAATQFYFNPKKAALRAGYVDGTQWNSGSLGDYSVALGNNVIASALYSTAIGFNINVSGTANVGLGTGHVVDGFVATAFGGGNTSSGSWSTATGIQTFALGDKSFSAGEATSANGDWSTAFGQNSIANATHSFSIGRFNVGSGDTSMWVATDALFEIGNGINNANRSNAFSVLKNGTVTINESYSLPTADGVSGQVLTTDGSGAITFETPSTVEKIDDLSDGKSDINGSSIFLGIDAGAVDDGSNNRSIGLGYKALEDNTTGDQNTAVGHQALLNNIDGSANTAVGSGSLDANTTGFWNTSVGQTALSGNTIGAYNIAMGKAAMVANTDGNSNVVIGVNALIASVSGSFNTVLGTEAAAALTGSSSNTAIGRTAMKEYSSGGSNVALGSGAGHHGSGSQNTFLGTNTGFTPSAPARTGSVFIGFAAGSSELTSNKLYIENSATDADGALIYGEFDNNILRVNGTFQISNPTGTGYALPVADGTANQVLSTDGAGQLSFISASLGGDSDWFQEGTTTAPNAITDDIFTQGNVAIGKNTADYPLDIENTGAATNPILLRMVDNSTGTGDHVGIQQSLAGTHNESVKGMEIFLTNSGTGLHTGISTSVQNGTGNQTGNRTTVSGTTGNNTAFSGSIFNSGSASTMTQTGLNLDVQQPSSQISYGLFNTLSASGGNATGTKYGVYNLLVGGTGNHYGVYNDVRGTESNTKYGTYNLFGIGSTDTGGVLYGTYNIFGPSITSTLDKYGSYTSIPAALGGTHYGVYSDARNATGYAGYLIGRLSLGNSLSNRYLMPAADGTTGQVLTTDGAGVTSWSTPAAPFAAAAIVELNKKVAILETENQQLKKQLQKFENLEARITVLESEKK